MKIDHLGIAVRSISDSLSFYRDGLGLEVHSEEEVEDQGVQVALIPVGESRIELLEPTSEASPVARFLAKRGEGLHHVCYEVNNLESRLEELKRRGMKLLDGYPRRGAEGRMVAFLHPSSANGVLVELVERAEIQKEMI